MFLLSTNGKSISIEGRADEMSASWRGACVAEKLKQIGLKTEFWTNDNKRRPRVEMFIEVKDPESALVSAREILRKHRVPHRRRAQPR